jgi:hypothetical protein
MPELLVTLTPPGQVIPGWERYGVAIVSDIPTDDGPVTLVLVDPACTQPSPR